MDAEENTRGPAHGAGHDAIEPVHALTLGYSCTLFSAARTDFAPGAQLTGYRPSGHLKNHYGDLPLSRQIYLRITPALMNM